MKDLAGRVAVVTGGGSGIGRGMALAFAEAGMHVAVADIDPAAAEAVRNELAARGTTALAVPTDVVERDGVEALAERVYAELGATHVLCNNAGVATFGPMDRTSDLDWEWVLGVNLRGVVHGLQAFLPRMKAQPGEKHVVNTASIAGMVPYEALGPYVASKYAVVGISESLRVEGAAYGLGCSVLCPGNVKTGIVSSARNRQPMMGGPNDTAYPEVQRQIDEGMDPQAVGTMVRQAVLDDRLYIFTHADTRRMVEARFRAVLEAFDQLGAGPRS